MVEDLAGSSQLLLGKSMALFLSFYDFKHSDSCDKYLLSHTLWYG